MNSISASIVAACGTALLIAGTYHRHDQTNLFLCACGTVVGLIGLAAWYRETGWSGIFGDKKDDA